MVRAKATATLERMKQVEFLWWFMVSYFLFV